MTTEDRKAVTVLTQRHPAVDLLPMMAENELSELARDIKENGLCNPLIVWTDPEGYELLLDGRNRLAACQLAGVKPRFEPFTGSDPVSYVLSQNVVRRHLNESQRAMVAAELANLKLGDNQYKGSSSDPPISQSQAAAMVGTSVPSVKRAATVLRSAPPELIADVRSGKTTVSRAVRIVRERIAEIAATPTSTTIDIRHGNYLDVLSDLAPASVNAIITDVHAKKFLPELSDLAVWSDTVLDHDGVLAVMVGTEFLPEVFRLLDGYRRYRTLISVQGIHVSRGWKPVLVYGGPRTICDGPICVSDENEKLYHKWGQDLA